MINNPENVEETPQVEPQEVSQETSEGSSTSPASPVEQLLESGSKTELSEDIEDTDLGKVKTWGKNWQKTAREYENAHKLITEKFGDQSQAELMADFYSQLFGNDFNPDSVLREIQKISPERGNQLTQHFAKTEAEKMVSELISEKFGSDFTDTDIEAFKTWKKTGMLNALGREGEDIPESLKYNADGDLKSEEEIEYLRQMKRDAEALKKQVAELKGGLEKDKLSTQEQELQEKVNTFTEGRLKIVENYFSKLGTTPSEKDTKEVAQKKTLLNNIVLTATQGLYGMNPEYTADYNAALEHLKKGEDLLARRYEKRIESHLDTISKQIFRLMSPVFEQFLTVPSESPRIEISEGGAIPPNQQPDKQDGDFNPIERMKQLQLEGKLPA